jgi:hypothetical protein
MFYLKIEVMLFEVTNPDLVLEEISKLQPINYNQFRWWRRFESKTKPLPKGSTFLQRIKNKEFEFSHYYWQAQLCEMEINQKHKECRGDIRMLLEKYGVDLARRKRLWEDFNKIENDLLSEMEKGFLREFIMTPQEYEDHTSTFDGTTEEFYMYCLKTFDKSGKSQERRGRP